MELIFEVVEFAWILISNNNVCWKGNDRECINTNYMKLNLCYTPRRKIKPPGQDNFAIWSLLACDAHWLAGTISA